MTANEIVDILRKRWKPHEYLLIPEAPSGDRRKATYIDLLAIGRWRSRGNPLEAVEIKVSMADWRRELKNPGKADWWFRHTHKFWVAAPAELAKKIVDEMPEGWGLIAVYDSGTARNLVKAPKRKPEPIHWSTAIDLMGYIENHEADLRQRLRSEAIEEGRQIGVDRALWDNRTAQLQEELDRLRSQITTFEKASGITLTDRRGELGNSEKIGEVVAMLARWGHSPARVIEGLEGRSDDLRRAAGLVDEIRGQAKALFDGEPA